jgi:hypothetical protein
VAVLQSVVLNDNARRLNVGRFEVSEQAMLVARVGRNPVVADQRLGEDEDLATVGGVGHGLGIPNQGCGKDGLAGDVGLCTKGHSFEDGAVLKTGESQDKGSVMAVRTLIVKVAGSLETGVALRLLGVGIARSVLDATVARHRACRPVFVNRPRTVADRIAEGLNICDNMMSGDVLCVG